MEHFLLTLGILMAVAAFGAIIFRFFRQSAIIAFVAVGILAGTFHETLHIPHELTEVFTELGIIFLLFMAGLEVEFESLRKRWKLLISYGLGQILTTALLGAVLGFALLGIKDPVVLAFFGLCLTFSSTIVVLGYLKDHHQMESLHGQIILGLMVMQDVVAVLSLVIIGTLTGEGSLLASLAMVVVKMAALALLLYLVARFVLEPLFKYLARHKDILFLGSLGYAMGIVALCEAVHFSPEIGVFMAGASLSILPYRLEIQDKVEPMKDFGIILFFIALGYGLKFDASTVSLLAPAALISLFVVFGTILIILGIGYVTQTKSRPAFMIGAIINQISEFSLILATLCLQAGLFDEKIFTLITVSTLSTIFFSSLGHQFLSFIYITLQKPLKIIERRRSAVREEERKHFEPKDHVVVISYNELAETVIDHFLARGRRVMLIDIDPDVQASLKDRNRDLFYCFYADVYDPDTWEEAGMQDAYAIVSCMIGGQEAELSILRWLRDSDLPAPFVVAADSFLDARQLYEKGAAYVIQTEELAAQRLSSLLDEYGDRLSELREQGRSHHENVKKQMEHDGSKWF